MEGAVGQAFRSPVQAPAAVFEPSATSMLVGEGVRRILFAPAVVRVFVFAVVGPPAMAGSFLFVAGIFRPLPMELGRLFRLPFAPGLLRQRLFGCALGHLAPGRARRPGLGPRISAPLGVLGAGLGFALRAQGLLGPAKVPRGRLGRRGRGQKLSQVVQFGAVAQGRPGIGFAEAEPRQELTVRAKHLRVRRTLSLAALAGLGRSNGQPQARQQLLQARNAASASHHAGMLGGGGRTGKRRSDSGGHPAVGIQSRPW